MSDSSSIHIGIVNDRLQCALHGLLGRQPPACYMHVTWPQYTKLSIARSPKSSASSISASTLRTAVSVDCIALYADWRSGSKSLSLRYFTSCELTSRSSSLETTDRFEIDRIEVSFLHQRRNVGVFETQWDQAMLKRPAGTGTVKWRRHISWAAMLAANRTHIACSAALSLTPWNQQVWQLKTAATHSRLGQGWKTVDPCQQWQHVVRRPCCWRPVCVLCPNLARTLLMFARSHYQFFTAFLGQVTLTWVFWPVPLPLLRRQLRSFSCNLTNKQTNYTSPAVTGVRQ